MKQDEEGTSFDQVGRLFDEVRPIAEGPPLQNQVVLSEANRGHHLSQLEEGVIEVTVVVIPLESSGLETIGDKASTLRQRNGALFEDPGGVRIESSEIASKQLVRAVRHDDFDFPLTRLGPKSRLPAPEMHLQRACVQIARSKASRNLVHRLIGVGLRGNAAMLGKFS